MAAGSMTRRKSVHAAGAQVRAPRGYRWRPRCRTPAMVFISTGKNAPSVMRNTAGGLPRPNQRIASGM